MWLLEIDKWDSIESLETVLHVFENGINVMALHISEETMSYLINGAGPIGYPCEEKCNGISISYYAQKSFPME